MAFDQTSPQFLNQLRTLAKGFLQWAGEEGQEGHHPPSPQQHQQQLQQPQQPTQQDVNQPPSYALEQMGHTNEPPPQPRNNAAGMLLMAPDGRALFVRRAQNARDHAGQWSIPGGMVEGDESPNQTAVRECAEEVGDCGIGHDDLTLLDSAINQDNVGFTTYGGKVNDAFTPTLNDEHDAFQWARLKDAPQPLHPGLKATLDFAQDPLTEKGSKIMSAMKSQYGPEKGERVFYASKNKGTISGVDNIDPIGRQDNRITPAQNQPANPFSANLDNAQWQSPQWGSRAPVRTQSVRDNWNAPNWGKDNTATTNIHHAINPSPALTVPHPRLPGHMIGTQDVGTPEGARKAALARRGGGGSAAAKFLAMTPAQREQSMRNVPGWLESKGEDPATKLRLQRAREAGERTKVAGMGSNDQTGKFAEIEQAVREAGTARDPEAVAAATRAKMIGRPALQRKAAAARRSGDNNPGHAGRGFTNPITSTQDNTSLTDRFKLLDTLTGNSYDIDKPLPSNFTPHSGQDEVAEDAPNVSMDPTKPYGSQQPQLPSASPRGLRGGMGQQNISGQPPMAGKNVPKYEQSVKWSMPDGTVDEHKIVRPGGPPPSQYRSQQQYPTQGYQQQDQTQGYGNTSGYGQQAQPTAGWQPPLWRGGTQPQDQGYPTATSVGPSAMGTTGGGGSSNL
jgi:8-oxo-dGTP pyrophosphatase MutT (NUDIX family)